MTNLHNDVTDTARATPRRQLTRVLAIGAFAAAAVVSLAVPAQAASSSTYHVSGTTGSGSRVVSDPRGGVMVTTLANGTAVTIDCGTRGRNVHGDTVWHHITAPVSGYLSDYFTDTPGFNSFIQGEATCSAGAAPIDESAPAASAPNTSFARGATINYNEGYGGSCVYYALNRFHQQTGVYPKAFGDARYLASGAAANGWSVGNTPRLNSLVVFQPGQNGAEPPTGHAAWVEKISGNQIYVSEMNAPNPWTITHRWLTPVAGVQYIYTS